LCVCVCEYIAFDVASTFAITFFFLHNDMWMWIVQCVFLYLRTCAHVLYVSTYVYIYVDIYFSMYLCIYIYVKYIQYYIHM
jgi:hypothetical protein